MDWNAGYHTDLEYTYGYYRELCPSLLTLGCLGVGVVPPSLKSLHYLELGYGQGLSVNIHAAANTGAFWGTDFNPTQTSHAAGLAEASGSGAVMLDASFAELAARTDLPDFDVIALHGVWSWISDENRRIVVDLIRRKLRVGGIAYLSYNCFPGWAPAEPLRHLMTMHSELAGADAVGTVGKVEGALKFAQEVANSGAMYFRANPAVAERLKRISEQNRNYLAHEYFNRDWDLMAFSDVARMLDEAKLTFVASGNLLDHVDGINLTQDGQKLLNGITHPILKQSVRDYFVNQQFRRDIFVKGPRRLAPLERHEIFRDKAFVLLTPPEDVPMKVNGSLGEAMLQEQIYRPLLEAFAESAHTPKKLGQIASHPALNAIPFAQLIEGVLVLTGTGHLCPAQSSSGPTRSNTKALNRHLCSGARGTGNVAYLASPVTGSGIPVSRVEQLFLLAMQQGKKTIAEQTAFVWNVLSSQGQRMVKDGKTLDTPEENMGELARLAEPFSKRLPILKTLEIA